MKVIWAPLTCLMVIGDTVEEMFEGHRRYS